MPDVDPFEAAYGRLAFPALAPSAGGEVPDARAAAAPASGREAPRSRLLPRLALMAPRAKVRRRRTGKPPQTS